MGVAWVSGRLGTGALRVAWVRDSGRGWHGSGTPVEGGMGQGLSACLSRRQVKTK